MSLYYSFGSYLDKFENEDELIKYLANKDKSFEYTTVSEDMIRYQLTYIEDTLLPNKVPMFTTEELRKIGQYFYVLQEVFSYPNMNIYLNVDDFKNRKKL